MSGRKTSSVGYVPLPEKRLEQIEDSWFFFGWNAHVAIRELISEIRRQREVISISYDKFYNQLDKNLDLRMENEKLRARIKVLEENM